ncbi:MAG: hypothetical protein ACXVEE_44310, partial [Polyangiales bacterium]
AIEAGAKRAGCKTTYREYRGQSSSLIGAGVVATCGAQTIEFFQVKEGVLIECEHMEEEECEAIESKILDGVKANRAEKNAPIQP